MFLKTSAAAGIGSWLGEIAGLHPLTAVSAAETKLTPEAVQLTTDLEPVVRLIEKTPREKCFDMLVGQLRKGLPYRRLLAALFLAGIRNVSPQPPGFKFHCVFAIHYAHQLSLDAPVEERLLPLFWALDTFKVSQQKDVQEGDFVLQRVKGQLPSPERAWDEFHAAMDEWDEERADRAIVALVRCKGAHEIIDGLWQYGARDYRNIGHKAIFVANTWRTLQTIGWRHAEPALRSLVLGLLDFGKNERVNDYTFEDQSYLPNTQRLKKAVSKLPSAWARPATDRSATLDLLNVIRAGAADDASQNALSMIVSGRATAQALWDAVHLAAGELMMRQPGIYGIHTVTSANGLRYAFETAAKTETRLLMLLQGIGWMCQFKNFMAGKRGGLKDVKITNLPDKTAEASAPSVEDVYALVSKDSSSAAAQALSFAQSRTRFEAFADAGRRLIFRKGTDAHHYKYSAAIFEDFDRVSSEWRPHMLATAVYFLPGTSVPDSPIMERARHAVREL